MLTVRLNAKHFPLVNDAREIEAAYWDGKSKDGCAISRWLHENKFNDM